MIKAIIRSLLSILLVLIAVSTFFSCTSVGLQLLIKTTNLLIPGELKATVNRGYLLGSFDLKNVSYHDEKTTMSASELQLTWFFKDIAPLIIAIPHLKVTNFIVEYPVKNNPVYGFKQAILTGQLALNDVAATSDNEARKSIPETEKTHFSIFWQQMLIPIKPSFDITLPHGKLIFEGPLMNYHVHGHFTSSGENFPDAAWQINQAHGNFEKIQITSLTGTPLSGDVVLSGQVTWLPEVEWDAHFIGKNLNPAVKWGVAQSSLNLHIHSQGLITETDSQYRFELKKLSGTTENYPVSGSGDVLISNENYQFDKLFLSIGLSNLHANGFITGQRANLTWQIHIPELNKLLPDVKGNMETEGNIVGSLQKPHISATMTLSNIAWRELIAKQIVAHANGYPNLNDPGQLSIDITDLLAGNLIINNGHLQFKNKQKQTQLTIALTGPRSQFKFDSNGKITAQQWQGKINQFSISLNNVGDIKLNNPANLILTKHSFAFQPFCLQATIGQTCVQQANFAVLQPLLNSKNKVIKKAQSLTGRSLKGALQFSSRDLAFISVFLPQLTNVRGVFNANFTVSGTTNNPVLNGQADLTNSSLTIPRLGINLTNIIFHAGGNQSNLTYNAQAKFDTGILNIKGATNLAQSGFPTDVTVKGNDLLVMNTNDAVVRASPDIQLNWLTPLLKVNGSISIPFANFTPRDLTSTITLPSDVVFVTPDQKEEQANTHIYSNIKIIFGDNVHFNYSGLSGMITGDVSVEDKPGGDTTGSGTLSIVDGKYKAYGQNLVIRQGKFIYTGGPVNNPGLNIQAVKQLQVVTTSSGPQSSSNKSSLGNYSSNMQVVGVSISGTLSEPSARLFSEPAGLSQSDILSYLIVGRPASQATQQDGPNLMSALSLLSLGGGASSQIKNQFSSALGLSQLSISHDQEYDKQDNSVVENTSLLLGKALSPNLFLNYSLGLIEPINTLKIVYKMKKGFSLQSEHSTNANGVDLFYTIERD